MSRIILNADDFGRSSAINAAVVRAHREGVLTSASLMVTEGAVGEAVALARQMPELAVGLHAVVANGQAALPRRQIPHLVDVQGRFPNDPLRLGLAFFFSRTAERELAAELEAQFERFTATGLPLSHVDGHMHMHIHPTIFGLIVPLAEQYGARGIRLPRDEFWASVRCDARSAGTKATWGIVFGLLCRWCAGKLRGRRLAVAERVYGLMQTGRMSERYVIRLLRRLRAPTAEIFFHPSTARQHEPLGPNPGDLAVLTSPAVRQVVEERGLRLSTYPSLWAG